MRFGLQLWSGGRAVLGIGGAWFEREHDAFGLRPYAEIGFETVIVRMPAPCDRETIDRTAQVQEHLGA